jgi:hypothetical protein
MSGFEIMHEYRARFGGCIEICGPADVSFQAPCIGPDAYPPYNEKDDIPLWYYASFVPRNEPSLVRDDRIGATARS